MQMQMRKIRKGRCRETSKAQALKLIVVDSRLFEKFDKDARRANRCQCQ